MPIRERAGAKIPQANASRLEFITEQRHLRARRRRQLILLGATGGSGLIVGLTLMAWALFSFDRFPARSVRVVTPPPVRSTPAPQTPARSPDLAAPTEPSLPDRSVESDRSQAIAAGPLESGRTPSGPVHEPPAEAGPVRRTASWLVHTYGRLEAENRALIVAEFYSGERRVFWQRVLADVRQMPER